MPKVRLSTRVVNPILPNVRTGLAAESEAQAWRGLSRQIEHDALHSIGVIDRVTEHDAQMAAVEWEKIVRNGVIAARDRNWSDYDQKGDNPLRMLVDSEKQFETTDAFKNMSGLAKKKFNRIVSARRASYLEKFNDIYSSKKEEKERFLDNEADELGKTKLRDAMFTSDEEFDATNVEVVNDIVNRKFRRMNLENPEVAKMYDYTKLEAIRQNRLARVKTLADSASEGAPKIVNGVLVNNNDSITEAQRYLDKCVKDGIILKDEKVALESAIYRAQSTLDARVQNEMRTFANNAIVHAYEENGLAGLENTRNNLIAMAKTFSKGSTSETIALERAEALDDTADKVVQFKLLNDLIAGKQLLTGDGKLIYEPKSREAKNYPAVAEKFRELEKKTLSANDTELRYAEAALDHMIQSGTYSSEEIERAKLMTYQQGEALCVGKRLSPKDINSFRKRWNNRNKIDESAAAVEFDRAFGVSFDLKANGDTSKNKTTLVKEKAEYDLRYPGTGESFGDIAQYLKMREAFLKQLRSLPIGADRKAQTEKLLTKFKSDWFKDRTVENIEDLTSEMIEINLDTQAKFEAERLQAAEDERKRTLPIVSKEHPANQSSAVKRDPLEFYDLHNSKYLQNYFQR